MPYLDQSGRTAPASIALDGSGRIRAGFRKVGEVVADGEHLAFSPMMMDAALSGSLMMHDTVIRTLQDMANDAESAYQRSKGAHNAWRNNATQSPQDEAASRAANLAAQRANMSAAERERAALEASYADPNAWRKQAPSASPVAWSNPGSPKL